MFILRLLVRKVVALTIVNALLLVALELTPGITGEKRIWLVHVRVLLMILSTIIIIIVIPTTMVITSTSITTGICVTKPFFGPL